MLRVGVISLSLWAKWELMAHLAWARGRLLPNMLAMLMLLLTRLS